MLRQILVGLGVVRNGLVDTVEARHDETAVVQEGAGLILVILDGEIVMAQGLVELAKFKMLHTSII